MKKLNEFFSTQKTVVISLVILFAFAAGLLASKGYEGSYLYLVQFHNNFLNHAMPVITYIGTGLVVIIISLLAWRWNRVISLTALQAFICSSVVTQLLKHTLFKDWMRPAHVFENLKQTTSFIMTDLKNNSFPSGHSTAIFSVLTALALGIKNKALKILTLLVATIVAYSRVYIGAHFLGDILAGACIGSFFAITIFILEKDKLGNWFEKQERKQLKKFDIAAGTVLAISVIILIVLIIKLTLPEE